MQRVVMYSFYFPLYIQSIYTSPFFYIFQEADLFGIDQNVHLFSVFCMSLGKKSH